MKLLGTDIERDVERSMFDYMPREYEEYRESRAIIKTEATEFESLNTNIADVLSQFYVETAIWGLDEWERVLALPPAPNASYEFRRQRILAKLRGMAPATVQYMTDLVNAYVSNRNAKIIEHNSEYRFEAEIPVDNVFDTATIRAAVNEVKPAHLVFDLTAAIRDEKMVLNGSNYTFPVEYRICNMFTTADMKGVGDINNVTMNSKEYTFDVNYPICNAFFASEQEV